MRALEFRPSVPRVLAARTLDAIGSSFAGLGAPLSLVHRDKLRPPTPAWGSVKPRLSGICGSDLATLSGTASMYFSPLVSTPFVPGHEVVGELTEDLDDLRRGQRVVLDPVLGCSARGIEPPCGPCAGEQQGRCERVTAGHLSPGLQTGYCRDTGGGWGELFLAHRGQLHPVPDALADRAAVLIEPMACALRAVRRAEVPHGASVLVVGAGTIGILTLIALRALAHPRRIVVIAKHSSQASVARKYGAQISEPGAGIGAVRRATYAFRLDPEYAPPFLLGGADVSFDCAGSKASLDIALRATRAGGRVVLSAMPAGADLTPAWFRELEVRGSYSGTGCFSDAVALALEDDLGGLVGRTYPLGRWSEAVDHALSAGPRGTFKIAFDPRMENE